MKFLNKTNMLPDVNKRAEKPLIVKMAGSLEKKCRMRVVGVHRWKKRWCVLEGKLLLYFKTQLEYSHHLSPCRGSVNMGLVLCITQRGPCQLQIVTRSQVIIFRTKSKSEQDEWFSALSDAKNNNPTFIRSKDQKSSIIEMHCRLSNQLSAAELRSKNNINTNHLRYGRSLKESFDDIFYEFSKKNGFHIMPNKRSSSLRKFESDNRISFYKELHGLVRTEKITVVSPISDKESCRSRSLSYESIYFKPQEKSIEPVKSQSCRELVPKVGKREAKKCNNKNISKRMSRSISFFQKHCENSDSDDYDYIEIDGIKQQNSQPMTNIEESKRYPELPLCRTENNEEAGSMSTIAQSEEFPNQEANIDVIYVNNDHKLKMYTSDSESDIVLEYGTEQTVEVIDEPPPLPIKKKFKQSSVFEEKTQYKITNGVYVLENGTKEVIYDVPIPHGKLIEHFRRLTVAPMPPDTRFIDNTIYDDSLEPSLYGTLHMTPDSLEVITIPTYKRWSNDSGFHHEEPNSALPDKIHFEDSLESAIAMINHDRKIWHNVPNINSTDYFR